MALECIHFGKYTHQSDVWSYGEHAWGPLPCHYQPKPPYLLCLLFLETNSLTTNPCLKAKSTFLYYF